VTSPTKADLPQSHPFGWGPVGHTSSWHNYVLLNYLGKMDQCTGPSGTGSAHRGVSSGSKHGPTG